LSTIRYSEKQISQLASSIYRDYSDRIDTYEDQQVAKQEAINKHESRDDLQIRLDNYRWFWEHVLIANQAEYLITYGKYDQAQNIIMYQVDVLKQCEQLPKIKQVELLQSLRYNSSYFLNKEDSEKLDRFIEIISTDILRTVKNDEDDPK